MIVEGDVPYTGGAQAEELGADVWSSARALTAAWLDVCAQMRTQSFASRGVRCTVSKNWDNKTVFLAQPLAPSLMSQNPSGPSDQTLWETVQRLHAIVEASPVAIIALDGEGRVKMWNRSADAFSAGTRTK